MNKEKKSVLGEAVVEVKEILKAADKKAKDSLAEFMPDKFDKLLKEELEKNNKESVKESDKDKNKEPVTEGNANADKNKEPINEVENIDMRNMSMTDVEEAYDEANPNDQIQVEPDEIINLDDIEAELGEMNAMANEADSVQEAQIEQKSDPYNNFMQLYGQMSEMVKEMKNAKIQNELGDKFNTQMTEMYGESYEAQLGENLASLREMYIARQKGEPFEKTASVNEEAVIENAVSEEAVTEEVVAEENVSEEAVTEEVVAEENVSEEAVTEEVVAEENVSEMHKGNLGSATIDKLHKGNIGSQTIDEESDTEELEDKRDDCVTDEAGGHGVALSHNKHVGSDQVLRPEYASYKKPKLRLALQKENWEKRMNGLLDENKKITKSLNNKNSSNKEMGGIINEFKENLTKYREQLQEMAVFNTNLAYTNNLLLNEDLALNGDDKKKIVSEFKNVDSITESEEKYKQLVEDFSGADGAKKTLTESIEDKVNDTIEPSSSQTIVEQVNEKTAYGDKHLDKIKKMMNYKRVK